jgi:protein unc-45
LPSFFFFFLLLFFIHPFLSYFSFNRIVILFELASSTSTAFLTRERLPLFLGFLQSRPRSSTADRDKLQPQTPFSLAARMAAIPSTGTVAATATAASPTQKSELSREDQTLLLFAGLMEGGKEDDETVRDLDRLTKVLNDDVEATMKGEASICKLIDSDCVDTLLGYLDMRQPDIVRGHATLTTSSYLKAAGDDGAQKLSEFFYDRVKRGTYDDYIVAFCVAAAVFPIVPELTAEMFLGEGFLASLGPLMRRKWKSRKVETACLDMLNVACMNAACREAVQKYCVEWLEEIVDQDPDDVVKDMFAANPDGNLGEGSISMRRHSRQVQNLAAVILAKLKVLTRCSFVAAS